MDKVMISLLWDVGARIGEIGSNYQAISFDKYGALISVRENIG